MYQKKNNNLIIYYLFLLLPISFLIGSFFVNLIATLISIYTLIWILKNKKYTVFIERPYIYLFLLFLLFLLSSTFSIYTVPTFQNSLSYLLNLFLFLSLIYLFSNDKNKLFYISRFIFVIVILICLDLWIQKYAGKNVLGYTVQQAGRLTSVFRDEQIPGSVIFKFLPFVIYYLFQEKKSQIIVNLKYLILIFIYFSVLITGERASSILITILFIFLLITNFNSIDRKKILSYFVLISIVFLALLSQKNSVIKERFNYTFTQSKNNVYLKFYDNSFQIFKKNILLGTGPQTYRYECPKISKNCSTHPHNFVFELLSDSGIFAPIILVISLFSLVFHKIKRVNNKFFKTLIPIYSILLFFPLIPTGSFFTSFHMVLTWFSLGFLYSIEEK